MVIKLKRLNHTNTPGDQIFTELVSTRFTGEHILSGSKRGTEGSRSPSPSLTSVQAGRRMACGPQPGSYPRPLPEGGLWGPKSTWVWPCPPRGPNLSKPGQVVATCALWTSQAPELGHGASPGQGALRADWVSPPPPPETAGWAALRLDRVPPHHPSCAAGHAGSSRERTFSHCQGPLCPGRPWEREGAPGRDRSPRPSLWLP